MRVHGGEGNADSKAIGDPATEVNVEVVLRRVPVGAKFEHCSNAIEQERWNHQGLTYSDEKSVFRSHGARQSRRWDA